MMREVQGQAGKRSQHSDVRISKRCRTRHRQTYSTAQGKTKAKTLGLNITARPRLFSQQHDPRLQLHRDGAALEKRQSRSQEGLQRLQTPFLFAQLPTTLEARESNDTDDVMWWPGRSHSAEVREKPDLLNPDSVPCPGPLPQWSSGT